jgi:N-acetylgalactosamine kinase
VRAADVRLPPGAAFVVANSLAVSKKAETADRRYNLRVVECRLAAALIARALGAEPSAAAAVRTLREVEPAIAAKYGPGLDGKVCVFVCLLACLLVDLACFDAAA